jgi:hypothetical protein
MVPASETGLTVIVEVVLDAEAQVPFVTITL